MEYTAYYRVSTDKQGIKGLGMEAQRTDVLRYTGAHQLIAEFIEVESGKTNNRKELAQALEHCKAHGSTLIIAKLDRLSRNSLFINQLLESEVKFICCDMPDANNLTLRIMAAIAQHEREAISERTKKALKVAKERGTKLGSPNPHAGNLASIQARRATSYSANQELKEAFNKLKNQGKTYPVILYELDKMGFRSHSGKPLNKTILSRIAKTLDNS